MSSENGGYIFLGVVFVLAMGALTAIGVSRGGAEPVECAYDVNRVVKMHEETRAAEEKAERCGENLMMCETILKKVMR